MNDNFWVGFEKRAADELDGGTREHLRTLSATAGRASKSKRNTVAPAMVGAGLGMVGGMAAGNRYLKNPKHRGALTAALMVAGAGAGGYSAHKRNKHIDEARGHIFGSGAASAPAGE